jgi:hypothetical protein
VHYIASTDRARAKRDGRAFARRGELTLQVLCSGMQPAHDLQRRLHRHSPV